MHKKSGITILTMTLLLIPWWCLAVQVNDVLVIARIQTADIHFKAIGEGSRHAYSGKVILRVAKVLLARQEVVRERFLGVIGRSDARQGGAPGQTG